MKIYIYLFGIYRVHDYAYIKHLQDKCAQVQPIASSKRTPKGNLSKSVLFAEPTSTSSSTNTTSNGKNSGGMSANVPSFYAPNNYLDLDTPLTASSLDAAKQFCG